MVRLKERESCKAKIEVSKKNIKSSRLQASELCSAVTLKKHSAPKP